MDSFDNLRSVWQSLPQPAAPDVRTVVAAARRGRTRLAGKLALAIVSLTATLIYISWGMVHWQFAYVSTKVGMGVAVLAIIAAVIANSSLLRLLLGRVDSAADSRAYLSQLRRYQERQRLLQTTGLRIYFLLLSLGMGLYFFEFLMRSWLVGALAYGFTALWFAFSWFYLMPRSLRKQNRQLAELTEQVERISQQL